MIIIGEKLNSSIPSSFNAMNTKNTEALIELIKAQEKAGATYLDINAAVCGDENDVLKYIINLVKENSNCGIMLDSPSPDTLLTSIDMCNGRPVIINSVTISERFDEIVPEVAKKISNNENIGIVALPIDGIIPSTTQERRENITKLITKLKTCGVPSDHIYLDLLTESVATDDKASVRFLDSLKFVKDTYPDVKTVCGLSNVSFGLPKRVKINASFLSICIYLGLDAAIMDPTNIDMLSALYASELICGNDEYCMNFITFFRENF